MSRLSPPAHEPSLGFSYGFVLHVGRASKHVTYTTFVLVVGGPADFLPVATELSHLFKQQLEARITRWILFEKQTLCSEPRLTPAIFGQS